MTEELLERIQKVLKDENSKEVKELVSDCEALLAVTRESLETIIFYLVEYSDREKGRHKALKECHKAMIEFSV